MKRYEEDSVSIVLSYESECRNNLRYICRGNQPSTCLQQALTTSDSKQNGQFTLTDDKVSRKIIVTITSLTRKDSGSYLIGCHRNIGLDIFTAVELEVKGEQSLIYLIILQRTITFNRYWEKMKLSQDEQNFDFTIL